MYIIVSTSDNEAEAIFKKCAKYLKPPKSFLRYVNWHAFYSTEKYRYFSNWCVQPFELMCPTLRIDVSGTSRAWHCKWHLLSVPSVPSLFYDIVVLRWWGRRRVPLRRVVADGRLRPGCCLCLLRWIISCSGCVGCLKENGGGIIIAKACLGLRKHAKKRKDAKMWDIYKRIRFSWSSRFRALSQ